MKLYIINNWTLEVNQNSARSKWALSLIEEQIGFSTIKKDATGKPYIVDAPYFINWSHNETTLVYALSDLGQVGVDLEEENLFYDKQLHDWVLHEEEKRRIGKGTAFSEVWTRKEAILKCTGEGIHEKMNEFSSYQTTNFTVTTFFMEGIYISVCSEYDEEIECIVC